MPSSSGLWQGRPTGFPLFYAPIALLAPDFADASSGLRPRRSSVRFGAAEARCVVQLVYLPSGLDPVGFPEADYDDCKQKNRTESREPIVFRHDARLSCSIPSIQAASAGGYTRPRRAQARLGIAAASSAAVGAAALIRPSGTFSRGREKG